MRDKNLTLKEVKEILAELESVIKEASETPSDTSCIVCGENKVNLCTYCFTNKAKRILDRSLRSTEVLNEFEEDFNTIIWRI